MTEKATIEQYRESAAYIASRISGTPDYAVILGSGLGGYADRIEVETVIPYGDIPHFPVSTVSYQKGEMIFGTRNGKKLLILNGRFHYYEGWEMWQTAYSIPVIKLLGCRALVLTNAVGGITEDLRPGDLVAITDHIKLGADSPLRGANIPELGERFFDMQTAYSPSLIAMAEEQARGLGFELKKGVYGYMTGPQYETPAEIRMLKIVGANVVGMSTVAEVITAAHCSLPTLCISCVTNYAAGVSGAKITESEVLETGKQIAVRFTALIDAIISHID